MNKKKKITRILVGKLIIFSKWFLNMLKKVLKHLKLSFLNGLIVTLPLIITVFLSKEIFLLIDDQIGKYIYGKVLFGVKISNIYGIGFIIICIIILIIGTFARLWFGQKIISLMETTLMKTPYIKNIFSALKQLFELIFKDDNMLFEKVVLIEYPRKGVYTIAFLSFKASKEIIKKSNKKNLMSVFVPTTPNPTSGFLIMIDEEDIIYLDMSVEDAMKLIISGGILLPENKDKI